MQIAWGSKNNCGTNLNIEVLWQIPPKAMRAGRIRNFEQQKFLRNKTLFFTSIFCGSLFSGSAVQNK
jgi:hypothetical protein